MKHQTLILNTLDENHWDVFSLEMLLDATRLDKSELHSALWYLARKKIIAPIKRGKYRRGHFSDEKVIACFIAPEGAIAYWTALNAHGLTEQFPNTTFVQNSRRRGQLIVEGIGSSFNFIKVKPQKLVGFTRMGYGNHSYQMTDVEKTIVDCFDLPEYAGGYHEAIKGFNRAKLNAKKLVSYCKAIENLAVVKRLAYLSELLNKPQMEYFLAYAEKARNKKYSPFDPSLPHQGKYLGRWRLIVNMNEDEILEIANPLY
jgi:predicted transcriptional regulator of viral defense system